jgi:hypothetical protein
MGAKRAGWGTVNAVLNRLVAEGVITAFQTSFRGPTPELDLSPTDRLLTFELGSRLRWPSACPRP